MNEQPHPFLALRPEYVMRAFLFPGGNKASLQIERNPMWQRRISEKSLSASEVKLADTERRIQEFENNKDTLDDLATKVDEVEAELQCSEEPVQFLKDVVSEQSNELDQKNVPSSGYRECSFVLETSFVTASAVAGRFTWQDTVDNYLLNGVCKALALHMTASQQLVAAATKVREKLFADNAAINIAFSKLRGNMQAKSDSIQVCLDDERKRVQDLNRELVKLLVSERSLKRQLQLSSDNTEEVE